MRILVVLMSLVCFSCSGVATPQSSPRASRTVGEAMPNPISAPSAVMGTGQSKVASKKVVSTPTTPQLTPIKPKKMNLTDLKFSVTFPGSRWEVKVKPKGILFANESGAAMVFLNARDEKKPLAIIAESERKRLIDSGKFTVSPVVTRKNPDRVTFVAMFPLDDGSKVLMHGVFRRNPSNPKQLIMMIGSYMEGSTSMKKEVFGIIDSITPFP